MPQLVRRAHCLVASWDGGEFVVENYVLRRRAAVPPVLLQLLPGDRAFVAREQVEARFVEHGLAPANADALIDQGVLLRADTPEEEQDRAVHARWRWSHDARFFHFASGDLRYESDLAVQDDILAALAESEPPPSAYADRAGPLVSLGPEGEPPGSAPWTTLRARRTRRRFARAPLRLDELATLLRWTWGAMDRRQHPVLGEYVLKTSPSGGARHPIEVYPLVQRVDSLEPGIYHYSVREDSLRRLRAGVDEDEVVTAFAGFRWFADAPVAFLMTAVLERSMWKYRHSHAYRVVLLDAGHLGQTFHLVCTELGLAPFTSAALNDAYIEQLLELDVSREVVIYGAAAGRPA